MSNRGRGRGRGGGRGGGAFGHSHSAGTSAAPPSSPFGGGSSFGFGTSTGGSGDGSWRAALGTGGGGAGSTKKIEGLCKHYEQKKDCYNHKTSKSCPFYHVCKFQREGTCTKGDRCQYDHVTAEQWKVLKASYDAKFGADGGSTSSSSYKPADTDICERIFNFVGQKGKGLFSVCQVIQGDKQILVSGGSDENNLKFWHFNSSTSMWDSNAGFNLGSPILSLEASGNLLFIGLDNGTVFVYDVTTNSLFQTLEGHKAAVYNIKVIDASAIPGLTSLLLTADASGNIAAWRFADGKFQYTSKLEYSPSVPISSQPLIRCLCETKSTNPTTKAVESLIYAGDQSGFVIRWSITGGMAVQGKMAISDQIITGIVDYPAANAMCVSSMSGELAVLSHTGDIVKENLGEPINSLFSLKHGEVNVMVVNTATSTLYYDLSAYPPKKVAQQKHHGGVIFAANIYPLPSDVSPLPVYVLGSYDTGHISFWKFKA